MWPGVFALDSPTLHTHWPAAGQSVTFLMLCCSFWTGAVALHMLWPVSGLVWLSLTHIFSLLHQDQDIERQVARRELAIMQASCVFFVQLPAALSEARLHSMPGHLRYLPQADSKLLALMHTMVGLAAILICGRQSARVDGFSVRHFTRHHHAVLSHNFNFAAGIYACQS